MHNIPVADNSMDIVLMVDALHHFVDMNKVFEEVYRVLKPKGHFYAINESYREDNILDENKFLLKECPDEVRHGIHERRPKRTDFITAGKSLRLKIINEEIRFIAPGLILYGEK
jgi:ubiquinone/menaquinone biosynthesis C-methylase UbiE